MCYIQLNTQYGCLHYFTLHRKEKNYFSESQCECGWCTKTSAVCVRDTEKLLRAKFSVKDVITKDCLVRLFGCVKTVQYGAKIRTHMKLKHIWICFFLYGNWFYLITCVPALINYFKSTHTNILSVSSIQNSRLPRWCKVYWLFEHPIQPKDLNFRGRKMIWRASNAVTWTELVWRDRVK
jgi:hypothetical protein